MNCFYHSETPAVGICKNCNRGICPSCASELDNGIACKSRCESAVLLINELFARNHKVYEKSAAVHVVLGWAMILFAVPLTVISASSAINGKLSFALMNLILAAGLFFPGYAMLRYAKGLIQKN